MSRTEVLTFTPEWLALRESADAEARATAPLSLLYRHGRVVADLGCGTGSMGRWLSPLLPEPQHWILFDRDPELPALAARTLPRVTVETRKCEIEALRAKDLAGVTLVVCSALLDLLTEDEAAHLARVVTQAGCPALFSLTVVGRVELEPDDPWDTAFAAAFDAHQRRGGRLGPGAASFLAKTFHSLGRRVHSFPSPWRLGPNHPDLTKAWLRGWVGAATAQDPDLPGPDYLERRMAAHTVGELTATVHHVDLVVLPDVVPQAP